MQTMRYKFGPKLGTARLKRPAVPGELPDVEVSAALGDPVPGPNGTVGVPVVFTVPAYTPGVDSNHLVALHAVAVPAGTPEPTDPAAAVASALPQGSADASDHTAGGDVTVQLDGLPEGAVTVLTVLGFEDTPAAAPAESPAV